MKIVLKQFPPSLNKYIGRNNIWQYQNDKKKYTEYVRFVTIGQRNKLQNVNINITFYFKDNRKRDFDNNLKFLLDSLTRAEVIEDDNFKVINQMTLKGLVDKNDPRIEIEIEENI